MKLSNNTLDVLKNFSTINTAIFFKKGNILRTVSEFKTVLGEAVIDETIPGEFGIYNLNEMLCILGIHKDAPEMELKGNDVIITGNMGRSKFTYRCCDSTMMKLPPEKGINVPSEDATFLLTENDLAWVLKASSVLGSPNIAVVGKNGTLSLSMLDAQDDSAHTDTIEISPYTGADFIFYFKTENWKMMPGTYAVTISAKGVALFQHQSRKVSYWIALEQKAK